MFHVEHPYDILSTPSTNHRGDPMTSESKRPDPYPLRLPPRLRQAIRRRADLNRRSMQQELLFVLEREFLADDPEAYEPEHRS